MLFGPRARGARQAGVPGRPAKRRTRRTLCQIRAGSESARGPARQSQRDLLHLQVQPKARRPHHSSERKGTKLPLYYIYSYSGYYEGEWKNGRPHGYGRLVYDDGSLYEGCFRNGAADCKDALFVKDATTFYKGAIRNNKANGYGELATPKMFYKGYWLDDLPQGKAREIYSSASFY